MRLALSTAAVATAASIPFALQVDAVALAAPQFPVVLAGFVGAVVTLFVIGARLWRAR
jgi:hypothetical protein